jgi:hypothetical protein
LLDSLTNTGRNAMSVITASTRLTPSPSIDVENRIASSCTRCDAPTAAPSAQRNSRSSPSASGRYSERQKKADFALDDLAVAQLIDEAVEIGRTAFDLYHCTRRLNKILDDQGRRYVVKMMWEIVCADGYVNALEDNIIWRAADLLGVSSRQRVELRRQVSADMVVFGCDNIAR